MQLPTTRGETFVAWIKPGAQETRYVRYWPAREAHVFRIAAPARNNQANKEFLRYLQEKYGLTCEVLAGHSSRKKRVVIK